jgi:hypothetical protein
VAIASGTVRIGTEPTAICVMGSGGALVSASADGVFIGGPNVAVSGDAMGVPLPAMTPVMVPGAQPQDIPVLGAGLDVAALYGVSADGSQSVSFAAPTPKGG